LLRRVAEAEVGAGAGAVEEAEARPEKNGGAVTVVLESRSDIDLDSFLRVAWRGEDATIAKTALERVRRCRESFLRLLESDPEAVVYGVTTGAGDRASVRLDDEERETAARRPAMTGASFGEPLPERVTRGIVLARLANFLEGNAAVRPELVQAVAGLLDCRPLPAVPARSNGGAGEILALGHLFHELGERVGLEAKEPIALVNGSPCAAALVADAALAGRRRLQLAEEVFALSAEALSAPLEAYSADLEPLWDDEHEQEALRSLRRLLEGGSGERRPYQAPVSFRILPRVLGQARRAVAAAETAATISLRSVTDNPVYVPPDAGRPLGAVLSTGGYHDGRAYPALDGLAFAWADLCQLAERQTERLLVEPAALGEADRFLNLLSMVQVGWVDDARTAAQPTFLPLGGFGQNDTASPTFAAWGKEERVAACLEASLAVLAALASQALHLRALDPPPALTGLLAAVRAAFPPVVDWRPLGQDCERLASSFSARSFSP
jgi:histidine ammonia-lyase